MLYSSFLQVRKEEKKFHPSWLWKQQHVGLMMLCTLCSKISKNFPALKKFFKEVVISGIPIELRLLVFFCIYLKEKPPKINKISYFALRIFWTSTTTNLPVKAQMFSFRPYLSKRIYLSCFVIKDDHTSNAVTQTECNQQHQLCRKIHTLCFKFC